MKRHVVIKRQDFEMAVARRNFAYGQLAKKLGVHRVYVMLLKNENAYAYRPSPQLRKKMLRLLKVKFDDIFEIKMKENIVRK